MNTCPECNRFLGDAGHARTCSKRGLSPVPSNPLLALQIRNLIAEREFNTALANRELQSGDDWHFDHAEYDRQLADKIAELFDKANNNMRGGE